jgi:hypothetical protein
MRKNIGGQLFMKRHYWYGISLFIIAFGLQFIPYLIPALLGGFGIDIWAGDLYEIGIYAYLPAFWDQALNYLLMPVSILVGGLLGGLLFVPLYLWVHRLFYKRHRYYGFFKNEVNPSLSRWLRRGFLPALFTVYITMTIANILVDTLGLPVLNMIFAGTIDLALEDVVTIKLMLWSITGLIGGFVSCLLVVPTWFLDDAGLLTTNVSIENPLKVKPNHLPNITGVGFWMARLLKGYAGIAIILLYISVLAESIVLTWQYYLMFGLAELPFLIVNILMLPLYPIIILFLLLPLIMLLDYFIQSRQKYVINIGAKMGVEEHLGTDRSAE